MAANHKCAPFEDLAFSAARVQERVNEQASMQSKGTSAKLAILVFLRLTCFQPETCYTNYIGHWSLAFEMATAFSKQACDTSACCSEKRPLNNAALIGGRSNPPSTQTCCKPAKASSMADSTIFMLFSKFRTQEIQCRQPRCISSSHRFDHLGLFTLTTSREVVPVIAASLDGIKHGLNRNSLTE